MKGRPMSLEPRCCICRKRELCAACRFAHTLGIDSGTFLAGFAKHALNPDRPGLEDDIEVAAGGEKQRK